MDPIAIQAAKNEFAQSQTPPIDPCTNTGCKFTGCTCGNKCGCHIPKQEDCCNKSNDDDDDDLVRCDPCREFKMKKKLDMESKK